VINHQVHRPSTSRHHVPGDFGFHMRGRIKTTRPRVVGCDVGKICVDLICNRTTTTPHLVTYRSRSAILGDVDNLTHCRIAIATDRKAGLNTSDTAIVNEDRFAPRQHIVRVLRGTPLPASSQVSA
jgi:hypothetical protein